MRGPLAMSTILVLLASAGCLDGAADTDTGSESDAGDDDPAAPQAPEPFTETGMVIASMDPFNFVGMGPCATPTNDCRKYEFTTNVSAAMTAILTWTNPANDFDLYLYKGSEQMDVSGDFPPETEERIDHALAAGTYELWVVPWAVVADSYTLDVTFA